jgi:regulatory protein
VEGLDFQQALQKAEKYCAYQERSQQEVRRRLAAWKVDPETAEAVITALIAMNFLSEARYATAFFSGHYRIKRWGRLKIIAALRQEGLSDSCIRAALEETDFSDYLETIRKVADSWRRTHSDMPPDVAKWKLRAYLFNRGFEPDEISRVEA